MTARSFAQAWDVDVLIDPASTLAALQKRERTTRARHLVEEAAEIRRLLREIEEAEPAAPTLPAPAQAPRPRPEPSAEPSAETSEPAARLRLLASRARGTAEQARLAAADLERLDRVAGPADRPDAELDEVRAVGSELRDALADLDELQTKRTATPEPRAVTREARRALRRATRDADAAARQFAYASQAGRSAVIVAAGLVFMLLGSETATLTQALVVGGLVVAVGLGVTLLGRRRRTQAERVETAAYDNAGMSSADELDDLLAARATWDALTREIASKEALVAEMTAMWHRLVPDADPLRLEQVTSELRWRTEARRVRPEAERRAAMRTWEAQHARRLFEAELHRLHLARVTPEHVGDAVAELTARAPSSHVEPGGPPAPTQGPPPSTEPAARLRAILHGRPLRRVLADADAAYPVAARGDASMTLVVDPTPTLGVGQARSWVEAVARSARWVAVVVISDADPASWDRWGFPVTEPPASAS